MHRDDFRQEIMWERGLDTIAQIQQLPDLGTALPRFSEVPVQRRHTFLNFTGRAISRRERRYLKYE
jgi:hypothetical protein